MPMGYNADISSDEAKAMDAILSHALMVRPIGQNDEEIRGVCMEYPFKERHNLNALTRKGWLRMWTTSMMDRERTIVSPMVEILVTSGALRTYQERRRSMIPKNN